MPTLCKRCGKYPIQSKWKRLCRYCVKEENKPIESNHDKLRQAYSEANKKYESKCENCQLKLPDEFEDENLNVICVAQYSHIIPKSLAPNLKYNVNNISRLCPSCHTMWEHGDRKSMQVWKLYEDRLKKIGVDINKYLFK